MEHSSGLPLSYSSEATVAADGSLILPASPRLPLETGEKVTIVISRRPLNDAGDSGSLEGTVLRYDDPFGPATDPDDWEVLT
ncbi:MAG: hypothetical protein M3Y56_05145 [Armatimonadota bacterium]|nr:hypothetical protein [Armatimonadota bacterium]